MLNPLKLLPFFKNDKPQVIISDSVEATEITADHDLNVHSGTEVINVGDKINELISDFKAHTVQLADLSTKLNEINSQVVNITNLQRDINSHKEELATIEDKITKQTEVLTKTNETLEAANADVTKIKREINDIKFTPPEVMLTAKSLSLTNVNVTEKLTALKLESPDVNVSGMLKSMGDSYLAKTNLTGDLTQNDTLFITGGNSISGLPVLYLQSSDLAKSLDLFNGTISFNKEGLASVITLLLDQIVIASNKTTGSAAIPAGQVSAQIQNHYVTANSRIFLSLSSGTDHALSVTQKVEGAYFVVSCPTAPLNDIHFDYLIINEVSR